MDGIVILKLDEVAARLKASVKTVRRRIACGQIRSFKEGGRVCVPQHALEEYLREKLERAMPR